ncbi:Disease resistance protein RPP13 [Dichanthelium oligosanthes]|uniref:Disease resistance protein RPP13 n=1 Tax=Dichanthelium oligosanthes TaxID=888268 RepID=A0A1E5VIQ7_9POAL|nr:Disease resistance protein RPP13 [Dichanthelium oligosanthes]
MESTVLSVSKFVLDGALGYAKSAVAEEVALQLGVRRHQAFVRDELEMMQAFLMAAHEERDEHRVVATWVKQVRDVAYDVEDCLQDFAVRLGRHCSRSWWRVPRALIVRPRVFAQMKELRARVEDVSQRNERYRLIKGSGSMIAAAAGQSSSSMPGATMSGVDEARRQQNRAKVDLIRLISRKDEDLGVIAVWGAGSVLEDTPIIRTAYDYLKRNRRFECYAWTRVMRPFNPTEFLRNIIRQFYIDSLEEDAATTRQASTPGAQDLRRMGIMKQDDLLHEFKKYIDMKSYMIVLCDMSTIEEWDQIKACFPNNNKGSRLLVCTQKVEVASLCVGPETVLPEHKQLSTNQTLYAFYEKDSQDGTDSAVLGASLNKETTGSIHSTGGKRFAPMDNAVVTYKESRLIGREKEKSEIIKLILGEGSQQREVISLCGMGGLGKTTLVKDVYQSQELSAMFEKRACATIKHPFHLEELISSLAMQLDEMSYRNEVTDVDRTKLGVKTSFAGSLEGKKYLIVLDDLSSTTEWDAIIERFPITETASRIIVTTRVESVAKHCSKKYQNIYMLKSLRDKDARDLFTEKVFENITDLDEQYPELVEEAKLILKKCNGLPLAIVTIGGYLANHTKAKDEWRKLNENISAELEMNPELGMIKNVLLKSYDGLPYYLKSCFLYLSIFPEGYKVGRGRLFRRWTAEGYSKEIRGKSAEETASSYFMELIGRRMVLPSQRYIRISKGIDCCQVHDLMREIAISKSTEENLVFTLEEGCRSNTCGIVRHLAINSNWKGDKNEFESMVDLSRIRSLTVFGKWQPFFLSNKMRLLRVLDLEDTLGLLDYHLEHIGKLLHLVYLSLRGCEGIFHLPGSVGNLRQLQTLDVLGTRIIKLPRTIIKLRKLRYIRSGSLGILRAGFYEEFVKDKPRLMQNKLCFLTLSTVGFCVSCCTPQLMSDTVETDGIPNRHDVCNICCCVMSPFLARQPEPRGVVLPRGIRKLKALRTLGVVDIEQWKTILQDIRRLTQLRRLDATGINEKNCQDFCLTLSELSCLEELSVSVVEPGLRGCLDGVSSPPKNLKSLHLLGSLVKLPEWTKGLQNLVKLKLHSTRLLELDASIQVIGRLPNLTFLCLWQKSFQVEELCLNFQQVVFSSLKVLELALLENLKSVEFGAGAMPKLEQLFFVGRQEKTDIMLFWGLASLQSFKEFLLYNGDYKEDFMEDIRAQLAMNPNGPVLKRY